MKGLKEREVKGKEREDGFDSLRPQNWDCDDLEVIERLCVEWAFGVWDGRAKGRECLGREREAIGMERKFRRRSLEEEKRDKGER